jgi:hypothetical protein
MSAGLWFFFWPPPDWPEGVPPPVVEPEPDRPGRGGGHRRHRYRALDDDFWAARERYLARALRPVRADPPRPPPAAPVRVDPPPKLRALGTKLTRAVADARAAKSRVDLQRMADRVARLSAEIRRIEREQDDDYILQALLPHLLF